MYSLAHRPRNYRNGSRTRNDFSTSLIFGTALWVSIFLHFTWLWKASISLCRISFTVIPPKHISLTYILILAEETRRRRINSGRQWPHVWWLMF